MENISTLPSLFRITVILVLLIMMLFVVHVPILKFVSRASLNSDLKKYVSIEQGIFSDNDDVNIEISKVFDGSLFNVWFDPEQQVLFIYGELTEEGGRLVYRYNGLGEYITHGPLADEDYERLSSSTNFRELKPVPSKAYRSDYEFDNSEGIFTLEHFEFKEFKWPYFYYFIPVIRMDWKGVDESSYARGGNGKKTHRLGFGVYLINLKQ